jgi:broad specificity phosphatase PhoE
MIEIWFEPHATSLDNEAKQASGWNDVDLSEQGLQQADEMIARNRERRLDAIISSDLQRAIKTARPTADALHIPLYIDRRLRECNYGDMTGKPAAQIEAERIRHISEPFPNGESYEQCMQRMAGFFSWFRKIFEGKTVEIIGHRATHYGVEYIGLGKPLEACIAEHWQWQPGWRYQLQ